MFERLLFATSFSLDLYVRVLLYTVRPVQTTKYLPVPYAHVPLVRDVRVALFFRTGTKRKGIRRVYNATAVYGVARHSR